MGDDKKQYSYLKTLKKGLVTTAEFLPVVFALYASTADFSGMSIVEIAKDFLVWAKAVPIGTVIFMFVNWYKNRKK